MQTSSQPKLIPVPFADAGSKQNIPTASQIGIAAGRASYTDGFPPLTRTPLEAGGVPPYGTDFNGVLNDITSAIRWSQGGGGYVFNSSFNTSVGGYPKGARLVNSSFDGYWLNTSENNQAAPEAGDASLTGWVPAESYGITTISGLSGSGVVLSSLQAAKNIIILNGTLTSNIALTFPAWVKQWKVINNCTGSFSVTCKTPSGSGVVINQSNVSDIFGDGTNIYSGSLQVTNALYELSSQNLIATALTNLKIIDQVAENLIINGSFAINQRSYVSAASLTAGSYAHDRWKAGSSGAAYTFGATAETITITTGSVQQVIEGLNNPGGSVTVVWDGTAQCRVNGGSYSASPLTVNGLTAGANITVEFGTGTVARVQCSLGSVAFKYRRRQYGDELRLCQRYYQKSTTGTTGTYAPNGSDSHTAWFMKVTMRASPTILLSGGAGTVYQSSADYVDVKLTSGAQSYAVIVNISCEAEL